MLNRRGFVTAAAAAAAASGDQPKTKLLMPSDQPDEFHLKLMWYNPVPPINQQTWRLQLKGLLEKPQQIALPQLRSLPLFQKGQRVCSERVDCENAKVSLLIAPPMIN